MERKRLAKWANVRCRFWSCGICRLHRRGGALGLLGWTAAALLLAGCHDYERDYTKRIEAFRRDAEFAPLFSRAVSLDEGRLSLRTPKLLGSTPLREDSPDPEPGFAAPDTSDGRPRPIDPRRIKPPFLQNFPGFIEAYEALIPLADQPNRKMFAVLSLGVVPLQGSDPDLAGMILEQVRGIPAFAEARWRLEELSAPAEGGPARWQVLDLTGEQLFDLMEGAATEFKPMPGRCLVWLSDEPGQPAAAVLAWRIPDELAGQVKLDQLAPLVARTVRLAEVAVPAQPEEPADESAESPADEPAELGEPGGAGLGGS